jgi:hypothetical protein
MAVVLLFLAEVAAEAVVAEIVGEMVVEEVIASSFVAEAVATDAVMVAAAEAAPAVLETMAVSVAPEIATVTELATSSAFEVGSAAFEATAEVSGALTTADTVVAVEQATSTLAATGETVATASVEQTAATAAIEGGATVEQATAAVESVQSGSTVAEAVSTATQGEVIVSPAVEVVSSTETASTNVFQQMSDAAQKFTQSIGETLAPEADPSVQKLIGQVAQNTATSGGDLKKGVENTFLGMGTGALGSEIADITGSDLAGRVASNATRQLATTGDVNLTGLASGEFGKLVGSEVADETGSNLLGKAASSVTSSTLQGKDATSGLLNLGINEGVNSAFGATSDLFGAPKAETVKDITGDTDDTTVDTTTPAAIDEKQPVVGGLAAVTNTPEITVDEINDAKTPTTSTVIPDDLSQVTNVEEIGVPKTPAVTGAPTTTGQLPTTGETDDILAKIDEITGPEDKKTAQVESVEDKVIAPTSTTPTEETPIGGLNVIQKTQEQQPTVDPATGEVKAPTSILPLAGSGIATGLLKNAVTSKLKQAVAPTKRPAGGLNSAMKPVAVKKPAAPKMDISKLIPIAKAPVKPTAPKGTLTPVTNIAGLTSLLKKKEG